MRDVIGCAPRIIADGNVHITGVEERYDVSYLFPRTFVAYDAVNGKPQHFVMGVASKETFGSLADFLIDYFRRYDHTQISDAMWFGWRPIQPIGLPPRRQYRESAVIYVQRRICWRWWLGRSGVHVPVRDRSPANTFPQITDRSSKGRNAGR